MQRIILGGFALACLAGCSDSTPLRVENRSGVPLESVEVSGAGFNLSIGNLAPGATVNSHVRPYGESSIAISFVASGKKVSLAPDTYFEGGGRYAVTVVVTPGLEATAESQLRSY